ncbi:MIF-like protein mif-2 [Panulirus ornatus]|uniref:MIF-like protein mif-2 n=1 Tax=Panulirus ornatus TaxID=150431 RepID=UPI003A8BB3CF
MPIITFRTNLASEKLSEDFHLALSAKLAEALGKPEERVSVTVETDCRMSRGGSLDPVCEIHVASIGLDTREKTLPVASTITSFLTKYTGVPPTRIVMTFRPLQPYLVAVNGVLMG